MDVSGRGIKGLHSVAVLLWAPVMGLVYAITMPFIGITAVTILGIRRMNVVVYNALVQRENIIFQPGRRREGKRFG